MPITDWPEEERPREKLLAHGAAALSDAELLAIFLRTGTRGKSAVGISRDLLNTFGGFRKIISADDKDFCQIKGLGLAKYALIQAAAELGKRYLLEDLEAKEKINSPKDTEKYLRIKLRDYSHEIFACIFLDKKHQILSFVEIAQGTIDRAHIYPREVVERALKEKASAVIFAHNHPSGSTTPSRADKDITELLKKALDLINITVLDHFIVGKNTIFSFAENGLI